MLKLKFYSSEVYHPILTCEVDLPNNWHKMSEDEKGDYIDNEIEAIRAECFTVNIEEI